MTPYILSRAQLEGRIPHTGNMFLLDGVLFHDATRIVCGANSHRAPDHPMRAQGRLGAACAVEYAAQAMALHGALCAGDRAPARSGFLVAVRALTLMRVRLDDIDSDLEVEAERIMGDDSRVIYGFDVRADGGSVARGRATVLLRGDEP